MLSVGSADCDSKGATSSSGDAYAELEGDDGAFSEGAGSGSVDGAAVPLVSGESAGMVSGSVWVVGSSDGVDDASSKTLRSPC